MLNLDWVLRCCWMKRWRRRLTGFQHGRHQNVPEFIDAQGFEVGLGEVELAAPLEMQQTALDLRLIQRVDC
jgi:hypothetical protein